MFLSILVNEFVILSDVVNLDFGFLRDHSDVTFSIVYLLVVRQFQLMPVMDYEFQCGIRFYLICLLPQYIFSAIADSFMILYQHD